MGWLRNRFGEPSTAAGLAVVMTALQSYTAGGDWRQALIASVLGCFAVGLPEAKK